MRAITDFIVAGKVFETHMNVALHIARNSPFHNNAVINYANAIRLFRTVLRNRHKNFSSNKNCMKPKMIVH